MQVVARELADDITPQVDLLEMSAPVVQVPQRPPVRHLRFCAVALNIVPVLQHALRRLLAQQVTRTVVAEPDNFRLSAFRRIMPPAADFQQTVRRVVPVFRARLRRDFRRQPPRRITLQTVADFSPALPAVYHCRHRIQRVIPVCPAAAAGVRLFRHPVQNIVPEPVAFPVLVRERGQPPVSVVLIRRPATRRIRLPAHPPLAVPLPACYLPRRARIFHQPSRRIRLVTLRTPVREHDLRQMSVAVIAVTRTVTLRVRHPFQPRAFIIKPCRLRARTVRVAHKLSVFVPLQVFISAPRVGYPHHLAVPVIPVYRALVQRVADRLQVAPLIILITPRHPRGIHLRFRLVPHRVPLRLLNPAQRVMRLRQVAETVIDITPFATLRVRHPQQ
ncbi:Uncharacterised protein [Salmonella enterica subsp. enterica serovar Typhi]|nr:Uncharacterised protein [Salmonella enterica subsp. enterica serovar Typhi]CHC38189.1 Uncharacterised protein [Salmonella enterica subsp. enterica serovar Typhi]CHI38672.1 Uncharacterised protein [Salmonella enterica subsp. enterica serovar Typhi]CQT15405.1 Uncharacterised protein [Salmonella enterica subsp. enterica serovar Typhi]CQX38205.1 Uncharacterised protein [Salmonella enterica subsp. enterica serovar Typhi]